MTATVTRGTSNSNARGSSADRLARREYLVQAYRANEDVTAVFQHTGPTRLPACRCYRCGELLTVYSVTVDRIIPGCYGGTYRRNNIRPACATCNSSTGAKLARRKKP